MLWEHRPTGTSVSTAFLNSHTRVTIVIETYRTCFPLRSGNPMTEIENNLFIVIIKMSILFAHALIKSTPTACASSVFISSCGNMILNQSACILSLGYFLINK